MRNILIYFAVKYFGEWEQIYKALERKEEINIDEMDRWAEEYSHKVITIVDEEYPSKLKEIDRPPFVIFYKGNVNLLGEEAHWPIVAIRDYPTSKALKMIKNKITIHGYSSFLERDVLDNKMEKAVIVKDGGIDNTLIITEEKETCVMNNGGLIISEYPGYVIPSHRNWKRSNRIKIGLSNSLILLNSVKEKELFSIIGNTLREGRDVFCVVNEALKEDHNDILISKGAKPLVEEKDLTI